MAPALPLPEGTVTFLFTDIEASTRLWEAHPEGMRVALARHDALLRLAIESHGGQVFKTVGDAFCAAFATAPPALAAAVAAQRAMQAEEWEEVGPLRVRMAVHTGAAEHRQGDYFGPALNRVARLLEIGHGGQILLSQPTYALARDAVPEHGALRDLGEHRLKDLVRPEQVFQLVAPGLSADFPALITLDTRRQNLPVQRSPLIGREREVAAAQELLRRREVGLVTMTGPSGTGKTRLALQVAAELLDAFEDGVFFVPLAPISDPLGVASAVAQTLEVQESEGRSLRENLQEALREKQMLLLLDNFEQVLEAAAFVAELLAACPRLKVLVTSRAALRLRGEKEFPVPPLAVPGAQAYRPGTRAAGAGVRNETGPNLNDWTPERLNALSQYAAVALFIQRAVDVKADFAITNENAPAVAEICLRLDGLPLAIELAAARVRLLPPQSMLTRLESRLKLLTGGARDLPARQQTLRGAIAWSYDLLDEREQRLFRRLAVFVGGCSLEAGEAVCADCGLPIADCGFATGPDPIRNPQSAIRNEDVLEGISSLADKSLLRQEETAAGEPRFSMLETIREFGLECLSASGEAEAVRGQHAGFYLSLIEAGVGAEQFETEHANCRAALAWYVSRREVEEAARLAVGLFSHWRHRGHLQEGRERLEELLALPEAKRLTIQRALLLRQLGQLIWLQGDPLAARTALERSLAIYRQQGDRDNLPATLNALGDVARTQGDYAAARSLFEESLEILREQGDKAAIGWSLHALGEVAHDQEDESAGALYEESLRLFREARHPRGIAFALSSLGELMRARGELREARGLHEESLTIRRELGHKGGIAWAISDLGAVAAHQQEYETARAYLAESLTIFRELGNRRCIAVCLERLAKVLAAEGRPERAARLLGAAEGLREAMSVPLPPAERAERDTVVAALGDALGEGSASAAWSQGRGMPLERAVEEALEAAGA